MIVWRSQTPHFAALRFTTLPLQPPVLAYFDAFGVAQDGRISICLVREVAEMRMLSETERESVKKAINSLNRALDSLLAQHRTGFIDIQEPVVGVTEALEQLEEILSPQNGALEEWTAGVDRIARSQR